MTQLSLWDYESELMLCSLYPVSLEGTSLAAAVSSETVDLKVYMQVCAVAFRQVAWVLRIAHLLCAIWQARGRHGICGADELYTIAQFVLQAAPAYGFAIAHALWLWELYELVGYAASVEAYERACTAVVVVV